MRRVGFTSIQNAQTVYAEGYTVPPLRTGYERVMAQRVDATYAIAAKDSGKVVAIDNDHIEVEYSNGDTESYALGKIFGKAAGETIPHYIITDHKVGDSFVKGEVIGYNKMFFERDVLDPKQVVYKSSVLAKVALVQSQDTFEDSSAISMNLALKLKTRVSKPRTIKVKFDQQIRGLVDVGTITDLESILCTIEDQTAGNANIFDERSLATLKLLSNKTPRAKYVGEIEKIEVFYNGEIDQMSSSLAALAKLYDKRRKEYCEKMGIPKTTNEVEVGTRIQGQPMDPDSMIVVVYITEIVQMAQADKLVFGNQLKSTVGRVMTGTDTTVNGEPLDALFGYQGINNRIVPSALLMGTSNTLLKLLGNNAVKAYRGGE